MKKLYIFLIAFVSLNISNAQWISQISGTSNNLKSVCFVDSVTGFVVGDLGTILKTTNGGNNWISLSSGITSSLSSIYFTDTNIGYAVGENGVILKTINNGLNWNLQTSGTSDNLSYVRFNSKDTGFVVGFNGAILKTIDGGANWTKQISGTTSNLNSFYSFDNNTIYVVGSLGTILKTINGGENWSILKSGDNWITNFSSYFGTEIRSIYFTDILNGYALANAYSYYINGQIVHLVYFLQTNDGGATWHGSQLNMDYSNLFYFTDSVSTLVVNNHGVILKTSNKGIDWAFQSSGTTASLNSIIITDSITGYIVGGNGTILKTTTGIGIIDNNGQEVSLEIFPNPATNYVVLKLPQIIKESTISIYDLNGQEVIKQQIYNSETVIDIRKLSAGVYFLKLINDKIFEVGKIIKE